MQRTTDFLLAQFALDEAPRSILAQVGAKFCAQSPVPMTVHRLAYAPQGREAYLYCRLSAPTQLDDSVLPKLAATLGQVCTAARDIRISRLEKVFDIEGHSSKETPVVHYVVEMDPDAGWMPEIARWYDTEHMPGLAAVPGCIHATRFLNHDHGPQSLAFYDLVTPQTLGSPAWLAVRGTAWSDITRPHFTNTKRTMFEVIA